MIVSGLSLRKLLCIHRARNFSRRSLPLGIPLGSTDLASHLSILRTSTYLRVRLCFFSVSLQSLSRCMYSTPSRHARPKRPRLSVRKVDQRWFLTNCTPYTVLACLARAVPLRRERGRVTTSRTWPASVTARTGITGGGLAPPAASPPAQVWATPPTSSGPKPN